MHLSHEWSAKNAFDMLFGAGKIIIWVVTNDEPNAHEK